MMNIYDGLVRMISHYLIIISVKFKKISLKKCKKMKLKNEVKKIKLKKSLT